MKSIDASKTQKAELPAQTIEPDNGESHWMDEIH
jgi:hypothetical protein